MSIRLPFFRKKRKKIQRVKFENTPEHIAIIMDGNGRWAKNKGLPRIAGHKEGMTVVRNIVKAAVKYNIKTLTLYAFSTENWKRPKPEVDFIMRLPKEFSHIYLPEMIENNVKIDTIGDFDSLPIHTKNAINHAKEKTKNNDGLLLNFALNYGGRYDIIQGTQSIAEQVKQGELSVEDIDENVIANHLFTAGINDPDLLIRTSGEVRLSNFLLWQSAYSELYFTDVLWPDFNEELLKEAILNYEQRKRRFGGV